MKNLSLRQLKKKIRQRERDLDTAKTEFKSYFQTVGSKIATPLGLGLSVLGGFAAGKFLPKLVRKISARNAARKEVEKKTKSRSSSLFDFFLDLVAVVSTVSAVGKFISETTADKTELDNPPPKSSSDHSQHRSDTLH